MSAAMAILGRLTAKDAEDAKGGGRRRLTKDQVPMTKASLGAVRHPTLVVGAWSLVILCLGVLGDSILSAHKKSCGLL
jgi:hypothetical protein